jgi:hypothetical protein
MSSQILRHPQRSIRCLALGAVLAIAVAGPALAADPVGSGDTGASATTGRFQSDARPGSELAPTTSEPKLGHRKNQPPADEEPEPPGPGDRISSPSSVNLFDAAGFRFQDPNYVACTSTSVMDMLNFITLADTGGASFRWSVRLGAVTRDSILAWERTHDTLAGGSGSDPHGWRNALNYYGWGADFLGQTSRVYEDYAYSSYERAVKAAVRAVIRYRKPVGISAWHGKHAQMITGYDGLSGDAFAVDATGRYTNDFSVATIYLSDPLRASATVNKRISYTMLGSTTNSRLRFQTYTETDSPYDDVYTSGWVRARSEWYGRWVIVAPRR